MREIVAHITNLADQMVQTETDVQATIGEARWWEIENVQRQLVLDVLIEARKRLQYIEDAAALTLRPPLGNVQIITDAIDMLSEYCVALGKQIRTSEEEKGYYRGVGS